MASRSGSKLLLPLLFTFFRCGWLGDICDDGEYLIQEDLGPPSNYRCSSDNRYGPKQQFLVPAGAGNCSDTHSHAQPRCIDYKNFHYQQTPPTHGDYRHLPPEPGEYQYLPPQRWLQLLRRGGVVFLYHPCTDEELVEELRTVAQSCLNYYVMTPYPNITVEKPLAVVTWGCIYRMEWVHDVEIKEWLVARRLRINGSYKGATYNHSLLHAVEAKPLRSVCSEKKKKTTPLTTTELVSPSAATPASTDTPVSSSSPCVSNSSSNQSSHEDRAVCGDHHDVVKKLQKHKQSLLILTVLLGVVLVGFLLFLLWKAIVAWSRSRPKKHQSYKSVSHYFPFSHKDYSGDVAMPELGMPKGMGAERKVLLGESDEDDEF